MRRRVVVLVQRSDLSDLTAWSVETATQRLVDVAQMLYLKGVHLPLVTIPVSSTYTCGYIRRLTGVLKGAVRGTSGIPMGNVRVVNWFDTLEDGLAQFPFLPQLSARSRVLSTAVDSYLTYDDAQRFYPRRPWRFPEDEAHIEYWSTRWHRISTISEFAGAAND